MDSLPIAALAPIVILLATVALAARLSRSFLQSAILSVGLLLSLPLLGLVSVISPWLPSQLSTPLADLEQPRELRDYARPLAATLAAIPLFLAIAVPSLDRREL